MRRLEQAVCFLLFGVTSADSAASIGGNRPVAAFAVPRIHSDNDRIASTRQIQPSTSFLNAPPRGFYPLASTADDNDNEQPEDAEKEERKQRNIRKKVKQLANNFVVRPIVSTVPLPRAIASVLKDATVSAVDMAVEEVLSRRQWGDQGGGSRGDLSGDAIDYNVTGLVNDAFAPMEASLIEMEDALRHARQSMSEAKEQATEAIEAVQVAAIAQAAGAATAVAAAEEVASQEILADIYDDTIDVDVSTLTYDDVGYHQSEMDPPFLDEAQCLVPGEAIVRVEKAPENSRRIFAGIDIFASVDDVWNVRMILTDRKRSFAIYMYTVLTHRTPTIVKLLTDYAHLQDVVPNLVVNEVLETYPGKPASEVKVDTSLSDERQCEELSKQMKGALLKQVGGAKVAGIKFSARTTLEVREWPQGLPDFAHFQDQEWKGKSRDKRAQDSVRQPLTRYRFPRPFALSSLPTRDISMQNIENDGGEFRMYQGVWRMQPLPGCAPGDMEAMRLTYAVEVSPRAYLPVSLVEGRIVRDLCSNLAAIRDFVSAQVPA